MKKSVAQRPSRFKRFFNLLAFLGYGLVAPTAHFVCGRPVPATFLEHTFGPLGAPPALLLAFATVEFLWILFGTIRHGLPAFFAGLAAVVFGSLLGLSARGKTLAKTMDAEGQTVVEKQQEIADLTERLRQSEADKKSLEAAAADAKNLGTEFEATKRSLNDLQGRLDKEVTLQKGGTYADAIQPADPEARDFAVGLAKSAPGAYDDPQGSFLPTRTGLRQVVLPHSAISSAWKYVSDPTVDWQEYMSPARRTLTVGLAGTCQDFSVLVAPWVEAIGGKARIMNGFTAKNGYAWAELWLGNGNSARQSMSSLQDITGRSVSSIASGTDDSGATWLVLDRRLGEFTFKADRLVAAWQGGQ
jgi:hypothetical protein